MRAATGANEETKRLVFDDLAPRTSVAADPGASTTASPIEPAEAAAREESTAGGARVVRIGAEPGTPADTRTGRVRGLARSVASGAGGGTTHDDPLYPRLLRLRHVHLASWHRGLLVEGMAGLGILAALADRATWWTPVILPVAAAVVVKFHDVVTGLVGRTAADEPAGEPVEAAEPPHADANAR